MDSIYPRELTDLPCPLLDQHTLPFPAKILQPIHSCWASKHLCLLPGQTVSPSAFRETSHRDTEQYSSLGDSACWGEELIRDDILDYVI